MGWKTWNFEVRSRGGRRKRTLVKISESAKREVRIPSPNLELGSSRRRLVERLRQALKETKVIDFTRSWRQY